MSGGSYRQPCMMAGVSEHAYELPLAGDGELGRLADEAAGGEVVYLTRAGRRVAAVVPAGVAAAGAAAVEALQDAEDIADADAAMDEFEASGRVSYPLQDVLAEPAAG